MATIVRVKRRRDENPLEILFLSNKKAKTETGKTDESTNEAPEGVLKFAGRVHSKCFGLMNVQLADMVSNTDIKLHNLEKEFNYMDILQPSKRMPENWRNLGSSKNRTKEQETLSRDIIEEKVRVCGGDTIIAFTDGSCLCNPGPCGSGACIYLPNTEDPVQLRRAVCKRGSILLGEILAIQMVIEYVTNHRRRMNDRDACIAKHVREAIRKEKLEREYKQHQVNILGAVKQESRRSQRHNSQQNRYKITAKLRALELDSLDEAQTEDTGTNNESDKSISKKDSKSKSQEIDSAGINFKGGEERVAPSTGNIVNDTAKEIEDSDENKQTGVNILCECKRTESCPCELGSGLNVNTNSKEQSEQKHSFGAANKPDGRHKHCDTQNGDGEQWMKNSSKGALDGKTFCLVDMEADVLENSPQNSLSSESGQILCNGVPLEKEVVSERGSDDRYVYDLYYTNDREFDFRLLENVLTVEAFGQDLQAQEDDFEEGRYDEDEDSNDEENWRNDYPDDDPDFFSNQGAGYYGNDLDENLAFETETGNQLADWMSWRCNIENEVELSSDDEVEDYQVNGNSYEAYYSRVRNEFEEKDSNEDHD